MTHTIRTITAADVEWLQQSFTRRMPYQKASGYFASCYRQHTEGAIVFLLAARAEEYLGHLKIVWRSGYPYFRQNGIPEINDLNVAPQERRQGIATALLDRAEALIAERSPIAGIGVGLYKDYGPAQRLYVRRGYVPDGNGLIYGDDPVEPGTSVVVDDYLVLFLTKHLRNRG